ncbi:MAG: hypothetical protein WKF73_05690 [Nocardioidaceae bacterium]
MGPPTVPEQPVPILTDEDLSRLLACLQGPTFENRRDRAIIAKAAFVDTRGTCRASELIGLYGWTTSAREQSLAFVEGQRRPWARPARTGRGPPTRCAATSAPAPGGRSPRGTRRAGELGKEGAADRLWNPPDVGAPRLSAAGVEHARRTG